MFESYSWTRISSQTVLSPVNRARMPQAPSGRPSWTGISGREPMSCSKRRSASPAAACGSTAATLLGGRLHCGVCGKPMLHGYKAKRRRHEVTPGHSFACRSLQKFTNVFSAAEARRFSSRITGRGAYVSRARIRQRIYEMLHLAIATLAPEYECQSMRSTQVAH